MIKKAPPFGEALRAASESSLFELLDETVDAAQLLGNFDRLRAMRYTLIATDATTCLPEFRNRAVVTDEESPTGLPVSRVLLVLRHIALVQVLAYLGCWVWLTLAIRN